MNRTTRRAKYLLALAIAATTIAASPLPAQQYSPRRDGDVVQLRDARTQTTVSVLPSVGDIAFEMKVKGENVLHWPFTSVEEFKSKPTLSGIPLLAPWANRLDEEAFYANGRRPSWPAGCASGCSIKPTPLYLSAGLRAGFSRPAAADSPFEEYMSDPAKPVPYRARPIQRQTWSLWLVDDQREMSGRTDVLAFSSDTLAAPLKISGQPIANLVASTSGADADWVVKLIDVYPDEVAGQPHLGGYQLMIAADIFRGRYRESLERATPIAADTPLVYRFALPTANHVFLPGHRIMVQVQSSWFPLYDRNPQTFVRNIFFAQPADYKKATQRIYHAPGQESFVELPVVSTP